MAAADESLAPAPAAVTAPRWRDPALRTPALMVLAVVVVYAVSLGGEFLNYDDDWLITANPVHQRSDPGALVTIWTDMRAETRHQLGAEYLPVRDTLVWLEVRLLGFSAPAMRMVSLLLYLAAALLMRAYFLRALPDRRVAELAAWLFALHPAHAESVAWLAGRKDVVALLLVAAALLVYARAPSAGVSARAIWWTPLLLVLATLGKGVAAAAPLLLPLHDYLVGRRPRWAVFAASLAGAAAVVAVQVHVGRLVGMMPPWVGGGRLATAATMGPVWLDYLVTSFVPVGLSVHHLVTARPASDVAGWAAYGVLLSLGAAAVWAARRHGQRVWPWAFGWFVIPLLPTSQILAPLQNMRADRYLLLAVVGPCVALAVACARLDRRAVVVGVMLIAASLTAVRAHVFADSVDLWQDAARKAPTSARPHYQMAMAYAATRRPAESEGALRRAVRLAGPGDDAGRRAANNLSALLASTGRVGEAQKVLRHAVRRYPDDPKMLNNLAEITARMGEEDEARRLFDLVVRRFPSYEPGVRNHRLRYGDAPPIR